MNDIYIIQFILFVVLILLPILFLVSAYTYPYIEAIIEWLLTPIFDLFSKMHRALPSKIKNNKTCKILGNILLALSPYILIFFISIIIVWIFLKFNIDIF